MKSILRIFALIWIPAMLLAGCATIPPGSSASTEIAPSPLKLSIGYDLAFLRVDLKRATHLVERFVRQQDASGKTIVMPEPVKAKNPYEYLVVTFGNGLIADYSGNLGIDLLRLYHLNLAASYDVTERFTGLLPEGRHVAKTGSQMSRRGIGITIGRLGAVADGNIVHLSRVAFHPHMRIVQRRHSVSLEPAGRRNISTTTIEQPSPEIVLVPKIGGHTIFQQLDADHIRSSDGLQIVRAGNRISLVLRSPGGIIASFVYYRTQNGCLVTSSDGYPLIRVSRLGNEIYVTSGRFLAATVTINSVQP